MPQRIVEVSPGSIGEHVGIRGGDTLLRIDGVPVLDLVDYQFLTARSSLAVELVHSDGTRREVLIHKAAGAPLGLVLESSLMSSPKTCANHCIFCFI